MRFPNYCTSKSLHIIFFLVVILYNNALFASPQSPERLITREKLVKIRDGNGVGVDNFLKTLLHADSLSVDDEVLPILQSLLNSPNPEIQLAGAMSLYKLRKPTTLPAIVDYLKGKNFKELERKVNSGEMGDDEYGNYIKAATFAILALGRIGDKKVIPLLKSLRDVEDLKFEMGGGPVHQALAQLGAVDSLTDVPKGSDSGEIIKAVTAIQNIRDQDKLPELMATVYNASVAYQVRHAALYAIGHINPPGIDNFLREILTNPELPESLRKSAAIIAGRSGQTELEAMLLSLSDNRDRPIAPYALTGLVLMKPDKYMKEWCADIMDPELDVDYRDRLVGLEFHFSDELLRQHREDLYAFLKAAMPDGSPVDDIRLHAWRLIYKLFDEKPKLELSEVSKGTRDRLRHLLEREFMLADPHMGVETRDRKLDEEIRQIVTITDREETR